MEIERGDTNLTMILRDNDTGLEVQSKVSLYNQDLTDPGRRSECVKILNTLIDELGYKTKGENK